MAVSRESETKATRSPGTEATWSRAPDRPPGDELARLRGGVALEHLRLEVAAGLRVDPEPHVPPPIVHIGAGDAMSLFADRAPI